MQGFLNLKKNESTQAVRSSKISTREGFPIWLERVHMCVLDMGAGALLKLYLHSKHLFLLGWCRYLEEKRFEIMGCALLLY